MCQHSAIFYLHQSLPEGCQWQAFLRQYWLRSPPHLLAHILKMSIFLAESIWLVQAMVLGVMAVCPPPHFRTLPTNSGLPHLQLGCLWLLTLQPTMRAGGLARPSELHAWMGV